MKALDYKPFVLNHAVPYGVTFITSVLNPYWRPGDSHCEAKSGFDLIQMCLNHVDGTKPCPNAIRAVYINYKDLFLQRFSITLVYLSNVPEAFLNEHCYFN